MYNSNLSSLFFRKFLFGGLKLVRIKTLVMVLILAFMLGTSVTALAQSDLVITGVIDGDLPNGLPKAVELYVLNDITDLSIYGLESANNGATASGEEFTFPSDSVAAGDFIYVATETPQFSAFFGFAPNYTNGAAISINGNDVIVLYKNGVIVDVFGEIGVDGTGQPWEYMDGWAYRVNGTGPDGTTFVLNNWFFSGPNALDGETTNNTSKTPFPIGTFSGPPNCSNAVASVDTIWPPNHKFIYIEVLGVTDPDGDNVAITMDSILQDEPVDSVGDGSFSPDGTGVCSSFAYVRAERAQSGNGRVYHIGFTAEDGNGGSCSGEVLVGVPKSQGRNGKPIDEGALFDSTIP